MDLNLDTLKIEILGYLEASGLAIFRGTPGGLEGNPLVLWDSEAFPDYQMFLEAAKKAGARMILFAAREFDYSEIEEPLDELDGCDFNPEERRGYERKLRDMRRYQGATCILELAFDHQGRIYVYELRPDWFEEFLNICEEISIDFPGGATGDDDDDSMGGYFSKN